MKELIPQEIIERKILLIRGYKVMLDKELAILYGVPTKVLIQAVKRNIERFPGDFMFQLTWKDAENLRSQIVTLKQGQHLKYRPYVFTEQGVSMLSSVLRSKQAIQVNIAIMRTFVRLRQLLATHKELAEKLSKLERRVGTNSAQIRRIFKVIRQMMEQPAQPEPPRRQIGFHP